MQFVLEAKYTKENATLLEMPYDSEMRRIDPAAGDGEQPAGQIRVWIRPLTGRDSRQITDAMIEMDRRGRTSMKSGSAAREKCVLSVIEMEGVAEPDGTAVPRLTREVYDRLPAWVTDTILREINAINAESTEEEGK